MIKKLISIVLILGLAVYCYAADKISIRKFGGINTRTNLFELTESESPDMSNFVLDEAGSLTKRNLFQKYNSSSVSGVQFTNLYKFYKSSDSGYLILTGGTKLYKASGGTISDISITGNTIESNSNWSFESFTDGANELVFAANQGQPLTTWNGTDATFRPEISANSPGTNCNILKKHKARLWAVGSKTYPYRIYYSSLNDGLDWNASGGSMDLPSFEKIMALEVLSNTLFVFTRNSIYAVLGDTPEEFSIQKTRSTVGTHAYKSVVLGNKLIYFFNKSGIFVFDGDESVNISETIQPTIDSISSTYLEKSASLFDKRGRLWFAYTSSTGTYNDKILVYDTVLKQWYPIDGVNFSAFFRLDGGTDKGEIFATCADPVGYLWSLQTSAGEEQITYSSKTQLDTLVTFNTVAYDIPDIEFIGENDSYTKLLCHFNGQNNATGDGTSDSGQRTVLFADNAKLSTAIRKFGNTSLYCDGTLDSVSVSDSNDFTIGSNNFTVDIWVYFTDVGSGRGIIEHYKDNDNFWKLDYLQATNKLAFYARTSATDRANYTCAWSPSTNTWYHLSVVWNGSFAIYINGTSQALTTVTAYTSIPDITGSLYIGQSHYNNYFMQGYIDEVRFSNDKARYSTDFSVPTKEYGNINEGTVTSLPIQINSSGASSLGAIKWQEYLGTGSDIQFTTRTGTTSDSVYFNGWSTWVSSNVVSINTVSNSAVWYNQDSSVFKARNAQYPQPRNILYYESDDSVSPNCVMFDVSRGTVSTNHYSECMIPSKDISADKFIGYWLKSPCTGNSIQLSIGEVSATTVAYTTANTVQENAWEFHHWPLSSITSSDIDSVKWMRIKYLGDIQGQLFLGDVSAYDFLDSNETITSTPNDYIQFRGIMGASVISQLPRLVTGAGYTISLSYSSSGGSSETSLNAYWSSKPFDVGNASLNKAWQWVQFNVESQNPTTGHTVQLYYETDDGRQSGTLSNTVDVTGRTVNLKFYLPQGTYGRSMSFKIIDDELNDELKVRNAEVFCIPEGSN